MVKSQCTYAETGADVDEQAWCWAKANVPTLEQMSQMVYVVTNDTMEEEEVKALGDCDIFLV
jgi:hypothetical protein